MQRVVEAPGERPFDEDLCVQQSESTIPGHRRMPAAGRSAGTVDEETAQFVVPASASRRLEMSRDVDCSRHDESRRSGQ